ncbi:MAG: cytidine deaminase [Proteobacteria bacterium]|nr:cytidine deaminase [Pseudomonadota bacterium]
MERPSWDEYFMQITELVKERSTCLRRKVGAVIVKNKRILTTGYNGPPEGFKHCDELGGCIRDRLHIPSGQRQELSRAVHAEQNAIVQAAKMGISIDGGTIYVTNHPCVICTKMLINAGIKRIVYKEGYPDELSKEMLKEGDIEVVQFSDLVKDSED